MVAFTWSIRTCEGISDVSAALLATAPATAPREWRVHGEPIDGPDGETECWLRFRTAAGSGRAHVRLDADGKASTLLTVLSDLEGRPFATGRRRPLGHPCETVDEIATPRPGKRYWHEKRAAALPSALGGEASDAPHVLIIGGGQFGLSLAARLSLLGVPYVVAEASERVGDSWRSRYPGLLLHDPVWYDHLPYMPFPPSWPVFTPRDKLADWLEGYAKALDINVATGTSVTRAEPPDSSSSSGGAVGSSGSGSGVGGGGGGDGERWTVHLQRGGQTTTLRPAHVVFATGMSGYPRVPDFDGADAFAGTAMHSSRYAGAGGGRYQGRRAVVVGSNTSAHDICQDLWEQGAASVTMLQRSAGLGGLYSEEAVARGVSHEAADLHVTTLPYRLQEARWRLGTARMRATDAQLHARLAAVGYNLDFGSDGTGVFGKSFRQGGGFYIDVGCAALLSDGAVGLRSGDGARVSHLERDAVVLRSGEALPCDLLIHATGFDSMRRFVADLVSPAVADAVGPVWGYGSGASRRDPGPWHGELRNMWTPTAVPGLWFGGGNLAQARHYSRLVALQLAARYDGIPTPVYDPGVQQPPHAPGLSDFGVVDERCKA